MPTVTRWALRSAFLWVIAAMIVGTLFAWPGAPSLPYPTYLHLITIGWLSNLIFGVAHWMFPRASAAQPRGDARVAWVGWGLLNAGLILRALGEGRAAVAPWVLLVSALLQLLAVWCWTAHLWTRVKGK